MTLTIFDKIINTDMKANWIQAGHSFEICILTMDINIVLFASESTFLPDNINLKQLADSFTGIWIACEKWKIMNHLDIQRKIHEIKYCSWDLL